MWSFNFCITVYFISINADITPRCPSDTIKSYYDNKTCYLFVNEFKSFDDAENFCNGREGNLAVVTSQFVNGFIYSTALEKYGNFTNYWIGGTIQTVKTNAATAVNIWKWTQLDRLMIFSDWNPTSTSAGNCTGVQFNSWWSAIDCNSKNPFVCQIPADYSYCDDEWDYFNLTNSCYRKFSVTGTITQPKAENLCIQKGGHLVSIHSPGENQFLGDVYSVGFVTSAYASVFWIGLQRNDNSDNWYWTDNSTFDYANWGHLWNYTNSFCAHFWPDRTCDLNSPLDWNADGCSAILYGYACKKAPNVVPID